VSDVCATCGKRGTPDDPLEASSTRMSILRPVASVNVARRRHSSGGPQRRGCARWRDSDGELARCSGARSGKQFSRCPVCEAWDAVADYGSRVRDYSRSESTPIISPGLDADTPGSTTTSTTATDTSSPNRRAVFISLTVAVTGLR
jgi:hypothetical protein